MALIDLDGYGDDEEQRRRLMAPPLEISGPTPVSTVPGPTGQAQPTPIPVSSPSQTINAQNPTASPDLPYVQAGNTGGYLAGTGVTIGEGRSITPDAAQQQIAAAQQSGISSDWISDFLARNPGDTNRLVESYYSGGPRDEGGYDTNLPDPAWTQQQAIAASQQGFTGVAGRNTFDFSAPPIQFDDPYTKRLEELVNQHLKALEQPQTNPALDRLLAFLDSQFTDLSQSPGYSPDELAVIRTQMLEPIERDRAAQSQRVLERTAARGFLPSSGLHEQALVEYADKPANESRIAAQRDVALSQIQQRNADLQRAAQLGQLAGVEIPGIQRAEDQQRRAESLQLASLLYDLPNRALQENLSVINGTPGPETLFNQAIQLQGMQAQQQAVNQQKWAQIGSLLAGLTF